MNFMFHIMLDVAGNILRLHYTTLNCDVPFSQGSVSLRYFGEVDILSLCKIIPVYNSAKIILKIDRDL